jgi:hypothetical protein
MSKQVLDNDGNQIAEIRRRPTGCLSLFGWLLAALFVGGVILYDLQGIWHFLTHLF